MAKNTAANFQVSTRTDVKQETRIEKSLSVGRLKNLVKAKGDVSVYTVDLMSNDFGSVVKSVLAYKTGKQFIFFDEYVTVASIGSGYVICSEPEDAYAAVTHIYLDSNGKQTGKVNIELYYAGAVYEKGFATPIGSQVKISSVKQEIAYFVAPKIEYNALQIKDVIKVFYRRGAYLFDTVLQRQQNVVVKVLGKWVGVDSSDLTYSTDNDTAGDTLLYVVSVLDSKKVLLKVWEEPTSNLKDVLSDNREICRIVEGSPEEMIAPDTLLTAYRIEDTLFAQYARPSSNTCPAQITSGSGDTYQADIYVDGLGADTDPISEEVVQLDIASGETIPSGTWVMVSKAKDGVWYMQVPIWL